MRRVILNRLSDHVCFTRVVEDNESRSELLMTVHLELRLINVAV